MGDKTIGISVAGRHHENCGCARCTIPESREDALRVENQLLRGALLSIYAFAESCRRELADLEGSQVTAACFGKIADEAADAGKMAL